MAQRGPFRQWSLDHKLQLASIVVGAVVAVAAGIIVPLMLAGGSSSTNIGTNNGTNLAIINNNVNEGTVNNYYLQPSATCTSTPDRPSYSGLMVVDLKIAVIAKGACWMNGASVDVSPVTVEYEIVYKNTSKVVQRDVAVRVQLPTNMIVVPHSTRLYNDLSPEGELQRDDTIPANDGQDIGTYAPGANAFVVFSAVTPDKSLLKCGGNKLTAILGIRLPSLPETTQAVDLAVMKACPTASATG